MWSQHPEIAKRWVEKGHGYVEGKKKKKKKKNNPGGLRSGIKENAKHKY